MLVLWAVVLTQNHELISLLSLVLLAWLLVPVRAAVVVDIVSQDRTSRVSQKKMDSLRQRTVLASFGHCYDKAP